MTSDREANKAAVSCSTETPPSDWEVGVSAQTPPSDWEVGVSAQTPPSDWEGSVSALRGLRVESVQ